MTDFISGTLYRQEHYLSNVPILHWNAVAGLGTVCEDVWLYVFWRMAVQRRTRNKPVDTLTYECPLKEVYQFLGIDRNAARRAVIALSENGYLLMQYADGSCQGSHNSKAVFTLPLPSKWIRYYGGSTDACPEPAANPRRVLQAAFYVSKVYFNDYLRIRSLGKNVAHYWRIAQVALDSKSISLSESLEKVMAEECGLAPRYIAKSRNILIDNNLMPKVESKRRMGRLKRRVMRLVA